MPQLEIHPATHERFEGIAAVLGPKRPDANVCWCLSHRLDAKTNAALRGTERRDHMAMLSRQTVPPGVLAYDGEDAVGWAAVAPRAELPFERSRRIPHVDDQPVWSIWCIRVRPGHRGRGIAHALLAGAVDFAAAHGAPAVEGYPVDNRGERVDLTMAFVGTRALFERAGFDVAAPTDAVAGGFPRVVMRKQLIPR